MSTLTPEISLDHHRSPLLAVSLATFAGVIGTGVALTVDHRLGVHGAALNQKGEPRLFEHLSPHAKHSVLLMGGFCMGTQGVAARYASQLGEGTNLIAPVHPDTGFHATELYETSYRALEASQPEQISLIGLSMGGETAWDFMRYGLETNRHELVEKIGSFVFRGTPFGKDSLHLKPRAALEAINSLGYSYTLDHSRRIVERWGTKSITEAPFSRIVEEGRHLYKLYKTAGPLEVMPKRIIQIRGSHPDPFVYEDVSLKTIAMRSGSEIDVIVDPVPELNYHAPTNKRAAHFMLAQLGLARELPLKVAS